MDRSPGASTDGRTARGSTDGRGASGSTDRRTVLLRGGVALAGVISVAGCTRDVGEELPENEHWPIADLVPDLPVRRRTDVLESGIEELSDAEVEDVDDFVGVLEERELTFAAVEEVADLLHLEYVETELERRGTFEILGPIAGGYAALVAAGVEPRGLELVLFDADGVTIGVAEIASEWAVRYNERSLSAGEYGELVAGTIESLREPPEPDVTPE